MRDRERLEPVIPDHEVLRKVGGGSYGEVWLAQGVTGAMRAVKVVRREDFEDERGFEREFEGILKYEPISRSHPGLVNILHVGRSLKGDKNEFYYYVMELGEDINSGREINAVEYEPRNLRTDLKKAAGNPIDPDVVIDVGLCLAEALVHLHAKGLAHRDIKPSNIIFVDGKAKLADIGLVATRGQRTFVGTEGFVPPEGPGSAQADVYGLGKVLYEMATGMDRLQFPELPDEFPENSSVKRWMALNQVICDICEPRVSKRNIKTADALAEALVRIQRGKRLKRRLHGRAFSLIPLAACLMLVTWLFREEIPWPVKAPDPVAAGQLTPPEVKYGYVKVISEPEGAEVYDGEGDFMSITPMKIVRMRAGQQFEFEFKLEGYRTEREEGIIVADQTQVVEKIMSIYAPPVAGQEWVDNFGLPYLPVDEYHVSSGFVRAYQWRRFTKATQSEREYETIKHSESGVNRSIVLVSQKDAQAYCEWQTKQASIEGYLNDAQYISPRLNLGFNSREMSNKAKAKKLLPFHCVVKNIAFAHVVIRSNPPGSSIFINDEYRGTAPLTLTRLKPGEFQVRLELDGFRHYITTVKLNEMDRKEVNARHIANNSVVYGRPWKNGLGMSFVPFGEDLMISIWETRIADYQEYTEEAKIEKLPFSGFAQGPDHPVVQVSRDDAEGFCKWLTERERKGERIPADAIYRLPTDEEWSVLVGIEENPEDSPAMREFRPERIFPWGTEWPPQEAPAKVGNIADQVAAQATDVKQSQTLLNYNDGYEKTSPVGSFKPNNLGLFDLTGNAQEWVSDDYKKEGEYGVLRGGGWNSYLDKDLFAAARNAVRASKRSNLYGFRVVLAKEMKVPDSPIDGELQLDSNKKPENNENSP